MYDPRIARFLQEDTYTGDTKDSLSLNLYTYCMNNPEIYWDPTGHELWKLETLLKLVNGSMEYNYEYHTIDVTANGHTVEYEQGDLFSYGGSYIIDDSLFKMDFGYYDDFWDWGKKKLKLKSKDNDIRDLNIFKQANPINTNQPEAVIGYYNEFVKEYGQLGWAFVNNRLNLMRSIKEKEKRFLTERESLICGLTGDQATIISSSITLAQYNFKFADMEMMYWSDFNAQRMSFVSSTLLGFPKYNGLPNGPLDPDYRLENGKYIQINKPNGYISNGGIWNPVQGATKTTRQ